jgi:hypothetical protein
MTGAVDVVSWPPVPPRPRPRHDRLGQRRGPFHLGTTGSNVDPSPAPGCKQRFWRSRRWFLYHTYLPYGCWSCADGRQVLSNRDYEPILSAPSGCPHDARRPR